jgi:hypothetical protein
MSTRITWIKGKMFFPPDVDPADIDWCAPQVQQQKPEQEKLAEAPGNTLAVIVR